MLQRQRLHERCHIHSVHFSFYMLKILHPHYFSPVPCAPRKVIIHMTSISDKPEVDLDMQMSFLDTVPCSSEVS